MAFSSNNNARRNRDASQRATDKSRSQMPEIDTRNLPDWDTVISEHRSGKTPISTYKKASPKQLNQSKPYRPRGQSIDKYGPKATVGANRDEHLASTMVATDAPMRINKLVANFSAHSRREVDALILSGKVSLNGKRVRELGTIVDKPKQARVEVKGKLIKTQQRLRTIVFNKPKDTITTRSDEQGRKTIYDVLPAELRDLKPVGRLDRNSMGLLLLTNDGDLIQTLTHPSHGLDKVYRVELDRAVDDPERLAERFLSGIWLEGEDRPAKAVEVMMVNPRVWGVVLNTGMNRQVRRMFTACSYDVRSLKRLAVGPYELSGLKPGEWRELRFNDIQSLKNAAVLSATQKEKEARFESRLAATLAKGGDNSKATREDKMDAQVDEYLNSLDPSMLEELV